MQGSDVLQQHIQAIVIAKIQIQQNDVGVASAIEARDSLSVVK